MSAWEVLFQQVRNLVRTGEPWSKGLRRAVAFARVNPTVFDAGDYWSEVDLHNFGNAMHSVTSWAREGSVVVAGFAGADGSAG